MMMPETPNADDGAKTQWPEKTQMPEYANARTPQNDRNIKCQNDPEAKTTSVKAARQTPKTIESEVKARQRRRPVAAEELQKELVGEDCAMLLTIEGDARQTKSEADAMPVTVEKEVRQAKSKDDAMPVIVEKEIMQAKSTVAKKKLLKELVGNQAERRKKRKKQRNESTPDRATPKKQQQLGRPQAVLSTRRRRRVDPESEACIGGTVHVSPRRVVPRPITSKAGSTPDIANNDTAGSPKADHKRKQSQNRARIATAGRPKADHKRIATAGRPKADHKRNDTAGSPKADHRQSRVDPEQCQQAPAGSPKAGQQTLATHAKTRRVAPRPITNAKTRRVAPRPITNAETRRVAPRPIIKRKALTASRK
ncbi:MAG: hypothetical protein Q9197_006735, partial [Variospora fuerteventurae]